MDLKFLLHCRTKTKPCRPRSPHPHFLLSPSSIISSIQYFSVEILTTLPLFVSPSSFCKNMERKTAAGAQREKGAGPQVMWGVNPVNPVSLR